MRRSYRIGIGTFIAIAALAVVPSVGALAASPTTSHVAAHATVAIPDNHPKGCNTAHFCSYKNGNGGDICINTPNSISSWSSACRTVDSVFNNGAAAAVRLYYLTNFGGAWNCLANGHYYLNMTANTFDEGSGKSGYQQPMANHVKSSGLGNPCT
jgi:hypothetical protein